MKTLDSTRRKLFLQYSNCCHDSRKQNNHDRIVVEFLVRLWAKYSHPSDRWNRILKFPCSIRLLPRLAFLQFFSTVTYIYPLSDLPDRAGIFKIMSYKEYNSIYTILPWIRVRMILALGHKVQLISVCCSRRSDQFCVFRSFCLKPYFDITFSIFCQIVQILICIFFFQRFHKRKVFIFSYSIDTSWNILFIYMYLFCN